MEIKCPKCRYKFIDKMPSGINEYSCVCPRCGTPFAICLNQISGDVYLHTNSISQEATPHAIVRQKSADYTPKQDTAIHDKLQIRTDDNLRLPTNFRTNPKKDKYLYRLVIAFIISLLLVFILLLFILGRCAKDSENAAFSEETTENRHDVDTFSVYTNVPDKVNSQPIPQWVKGVWEGQTQFYNITLEISDTKITERCGDKKVQGTYQYDSGRLFCRFPENSTFTYLINEDTRTISAGEGILLHKTF